MHEKRIVYCYGPNDDHAFDGVPKQHRQGKLDRHCPDCDGHGQWNGQIDLNSFRCIRVICDQCDGRGWIETGDDPVLSNDIVMTPEGYPKWVEQVHSREKA